MIDTKALREKILDLAIRGKLVPQDPNDEPASVLLERIRAQKQQMVKEGKLKAKDIKNDTIIFKGEDNLHYEQFQDGTMKCIEDEIPFETPESWEWCRFLSGFIINPRNSIQDNIEVSFIPMPLIQDGYTNNHKSEIRLWKKVKTGYTHFAENDTAIAKITPCFENKKSVVFRNLSNGYGAGTTELHIIRTLANTVLPEYVLWYIKRDDFISDGISAFSGAVGQKRIGREFIEQYLIPLPPVSEQERILEAIHTAFISIDNIEHSDTELNTLITIAKSKILDLAIRGKLVPQDPNDEPASVLLERIQAEKEGLIKQGKIKRDKKESVIFKGEDNSYYEKYGEKLPAGWAVTNFGTFLEYEQPTKYIVRSTNYKSSYKTPVLTAGKSFILGYTNESDSIFNDLPVIIFDDFTTESKFVDFPFKVKSSAMKILHINTDLILPKYAFYLMQTIEIDHENHQRYWISTYSQEEVALPPLKEQKRILSKLEKYFSLLDQIQ